MSGGIDATYVIYKPIGELLNHKSSLKCMTIAIMPTTIDNNTLFMVIRIISIVV